MMSGHGANPIFFNKKIKIGCPEHLLTPNSPLRPITFHFWTSYMYDTPKADNEKERNFEVLLVELKVNSRFL